MATKWFVLSFLLLLSACVPQNDIPNPSPDNGKSTETGLTWKIDASFSYDQILRFLRSNDLTIEFNNQQYSGVMLKKLAVELQSGIAYADDGFQVIVLLYKERVHVKVFDKGAVYDIYQFASVNDLNSHYRLFEKKDFIQLSNTNYFMIIRSKMVLNEDDVANLRVTNQLQTSSCNCVSFKSTVSSTVQPSGVWTLQFYTSPSSLNIDGELSNAIVTLLSLRPNLQLKINFYDGDEVVSDNNDASKMLENFAKAVDSRLRAGSIYMYVRNERYDNQISGSAYLVNQVGAIERIGIASQANPSTLAHEICHTLGAIHDDILYYDKDESWVGWWFRSVMASSAGPFSPRSRVLYDEANIGVVRNNLGN